MNSSTKLIVLLIISAWAPSCIVSAQRYWVGTSTTAWTDAANWSTSSGGAGGAAVPGASDIVTFDRNTPNGCILNTTAAVGQLTMTGGSLSFGSAGALTDNGIFYMSGGSFSPGSGSLYVPANTFTISGGTFNAGSSNIFVGKNLSVPSPDSFIPGTGNFTFNGSAGQDVVIVSNNTSGKLYFYTLTIEKANNSIIRFTSNLTDTFQVNNFLDLRAGVFAGSGFIKVEKDVTTEPTFGGSGIPIACTGPNPSIITLGAPLAVSGVSNFVGIAKSDKSVVVNVFRSTKALDDTVRIGTFDAVFIVRRGIIQFPGNPPVVSRFKTLQIESEGTFIAPANYLYNAGQHINLGGKFDANNGTYVFNYTPIPAYTQFTNHKEVFNNLILDLPGGEFSPSANDTLVINGNLTLKNGTITGNALSMFNVKGDISFASTMSATQTYTQLMFSGTGDQHITMAADKYDYWNAPVTIDKPSGKLILSSPLILDDFNNQSFTFKNGIVQASDVNYLRFINSAKAIGANNNSYVDGPVQYGWYSAFEFPIGNKGIYAPVRVTAGANSTDGTADVFAAQYFRQNPSPAYDTSQRDAALKRISSCEYWTINRVSGTGSAYAWLSYNSVRSCGVTDATALRVSRWNGTKWTDGGNGKIEVPYIRSANAFSSFSPFTLATTDANANPLPVNFVSFKVMEQDGKAHLTWRTTNEVNNDHFEIERSGDGISFIAIGNVQPANNGANAVNRYDYPDAVTDEMKKYYRIKQVDINNDFSFSPIVIFEPEKLSNATTIYCSASGQCTISDASLASKNVSAEVITMTGQCIWKDSFAMDAVGKKQFYLHTSPGYYLLRLFEKNKASVVKFIVR